MSISEALKSFNDGDLVAISKSMRLAKKYGISHKLIEHASSVVLKVNNDFICVKKAKFCPEPHKWRWVGLEVFNNTSKLRDHFVISLKEKKGE